jgi:hypothetical protein
MRVRVGLALGFLLFCYLVGSAAKPAPRSAASEAAAPFTLSGTAVGTLPGSATDKGTSFDVTVKLKDLDFAAGPKVGPCELDGSEAKVQSLSYSGSVVIPAKAGGEAVSASAQLAARDPAKNSRSVSSGSMTVDGIKPGKNFSAKSLDVDPQSAISATARNVPEGVGCTGQGLGASAKFKVLNVDAANGLIDFSGNGHVSKAPSSSGRY